MNANNNEATTLHGESRLVGCSSDEEPGAKTTFFSQNEIPIPSVSNRSSEFMHRYFPPDNYRFLEWLEMELRNAINSIEDLKKIMKLSEKEIMAINNLKGRLPLRITPYFASLIYNTKPSHPLRRNVIPVVEELLETSSEQSDPLHENRSPRLKELFTVTRQGFIHCYPGMFKLLQILYTFSFCRKTW